MPGTEILLLRHGQSEGNEAGRFGGHGPTPLTALGRAQAEATAQALTRERPLDALYTSDLARARATAAPVAAAFGLEAVLAPELRERSVGVFTGLSFTEAQARWPEAYAALARRDPDHGPPEGESGRAVAERIGGFFARLVAEERARHAVGDDTRRVLLVSHAFALNQLLVRALGLGDGIMLRSDNCALHRLKLYPNGWWSVEALNDLRHLAGLAPG